MNHIAVLFDHCQQIFGPEPDRRRIVIGMYADQPRRIRKRLIQEKLHPARLIVEQAQRRHRSGNESQQVHKVPFRGKAQTPCLMFLPEFIQVNPLVPHPGYFWPIVAFANVWKETGWNAIIYLAAITAIDPSLYEAASMDGAGRWAKIKHITLPSIRPTIMILLLMNVGNVLNAGFEIQYLLGNGLVKSVSETIDIYVLKWGISQNDFSLGTAAGIFKSVVSIILIVIANQLAKRAGEERLF